MAEIRREGPPLPTIPGALRFSPLWIVAGVLLGSAACLWGMLDGLGGWSAEAATISLLWLVVSSVAALLYSGAGDPAFLGEDRSATSDPKRRRWVGAAAVAAVSLVASVSTAWSIGPLPPAYHDEYSYLFQAETLAAGRLSFPSSPEHPELFDQMHVLNEGRFASRYYPGTGLWMVPFLQLGHPYWGWWVAGMISGVLVFRIGELLGGFAVGLTAGLLFAASPGLALFGNLLLAHHPALVGLLTFLLAQCLFRRRPSMLTAVTAGTGIGFAMLCRPATAAGVCLPFAAWWAVWLFTGRGGPAAIEPRRRWQLAATILTPIAAALFVMATYNHAVTGSAWVSPYQLYTEIYSPRHVYGFNNVVRGETVLGPKVLTTYDEWAVNLTPTLAVENTVTRILASWYWTLGLIPMVLLVPMLVPWLRSADLDWGLLASAIIGLHAIHVPYWYTGIMGWHYVFESGPLWILLLAGVLVGWGRYERRTGRAIRLLPWTGLVIASVVTNWSSLPGPFSSTIEIGVSNLRHPRQKYAEFHHFIAENVRKTPALVLVRPDANDRHMDYVTNTPGLDAPVVFGRLRDEGSNVDEIIAAFPERSVYVFDVRERTLRSATE